MTEAKWIPLTNGGRTLVDVVDYAEVVRHSWRSDKSWTGITYHASRYATASERAAGASQRVLMHRQLTSAPDDVEIDHRNGDGLDNRRENLRFATHSQNGMNRGKQCNNTSGFKGVTSRRQSDGSYRFIAMIWKDQRPRYLGIYDAAEEAARAYAVAAEQLHGEFARVDVEPSGALTSEPPLWLDIVAHAKRVGRTRLSYYELARVLLRSTSEEALRTIRSAVRRRSDRAAHPDPRPVFMLYDGIKGGRGEVASGGVIVRPKAVALQREPPRHSRDLEKP